MNIKILRQKKADLISEAEAIFGLAAKEERGLTEAEAARDDAITDELKGLDQEIARAERQMDRQRALGGEAVAGRQEPKGNGNGFASLGEQLIAAMRAEQQVAGVVDPRLRIGAGPTGMNEGAGADGGFLVQTDFIPGLLKPMYENGDLLSRVHKITVGPNSNGIKMNAVNETSRVNGQRWGGVQVYWLPEAGLKTPSAPSFRTIEMNLKKLAGLCYATDELLQDAVALEGVIREAFETEMTYVAEDAIVNGIGVGQPLGYLNSGAAVVVAKESGQAADSVVTENIFAMWGRMPQRSRRTAVWLMSQDVETKLYSLKDSAGNSIYLPPGGVSAAPYATLLGRPIIISEYTSAIGDAGDIQLVDLSQYLVIEKGGIQQAQSMHVRFIYDETAFRFVYRMDGQPLWNTTITPRNSSSAQSPFVILGERA